jgi:hypothetical protein
VNSIAGLAAGFTATRVATLPEHVWVLALAVLVGWMVRRGIRQPPVHQPDRAAIPAVVLAVAGAKMVWCRFLA